MAEMLTAHHLQTLLKVGEALVSLQKTDELVELINKVTGELLDAERSTVFLYDPRRNELYSKVANELEIKEIRIPLGSGIVGCVGKDRIVLNIEDAYSDSRFNPDIDQQTGFRTRSMLTVPLLNRQNELVGVVQVLNKRGGSFTALDVDVLKILSSYIAISLENARLLADREKANQSLLKLDQMKSKFIGVASHELLTPITVLHGQLSLICEEFLFPLTAEQKEALNVLSDQVIRLTGLVRHILNVSELEIPENRFARERIQLPSLFRSIEKEMKPFIQSRHQTLIFDADDIDPTLQGDEAKIRQAITNLIMNAIRFTPDGGHISVSGETIQLRKFSDSDNFLKLSVQDNGIGIASNEYERIFEPFYEIAETLHHSSGTVEFKSGGLGLGLPITKKILEGHRGWIELSSEPGQGSIFTMFLPHRQPDQSNPQGEAERD